MTKNRDLLFMSLATAVWCGLLWLAHDPGTFNVDELQYLLAAKRFWEHGDFLIPNGYAEFRSNLLLFMHPNNLASLPGQPEMTCFVPPYYPMAMAPVHALFGVEGMFAATAACYGALLLAVPALAARMFEDATASRRARWIAFAGGIGGTYLAEYGIAIINHMLNSSLLLAAAVLHPVSLAKRDDDRPRLGQCLLSGLLGGIACGIRAQSLVTVGVLGMCMFVPHRAARARFASWLAGLALPLAGLSAINWSRFGDPLPFSYGMSDQWATSPLGKVLLSWYGPVAILAAVVAAVLATSPRIEEKWQAIGAEGRRKTMQRVLVGGLACCLAVMLLPPFARQALERILGVWVVPLSGHRWDTTLFLPIFIGWRAAWLQSYPIALAALVGTVGLLHAVPEWRRPMCVMFAGIVAANIAFICALPNNGGYFPNQRYLIDAVVFSLVLAGAGGAVASQWIVRKQFFAGCVAAGAALAAFGLLIQVESTAVSPIVLFRGLLPVAALVLAAGAALVVFGGDSRRGMGARLLALAAPACLVLPLAAHVRVAMFSTHTYRMTRRQASEVVGAVIPDGSLVIVYGGQREPVGLLKVDRDVWVADADRTEWEGVPELLLAAKERGLRKHFFLTEGPMPQEFLDRLAQDWDGQLLMQKPFLVMRLLERERDGGQGGEATENSEQ